MSTAGTHINYRGENLIIDPDIVSKAQSGDVEAGEVIHNAYKDTVAMKRGPSAKDEPKGPVTGSVEDKAALIDKLEDKRKNTYKDFNDEERRQVYDFGITNNLMDAASAFANRNGTNHPIERGVNNLVKAAIPLTLPLMPGAIVATPLRTALMLAANYGGSKLGSYAADAAGADPETSELIGTGSGILAGGLTASPKISGAIRGAASALPKNMFSRAGFFGGGGTLAGMAAGHYAGVSPYIGGLAGGAAGTMLSAAPEVITGAVSGFKKSPYVDPKIAKLFGFDNDNATLEGNKARELARKAGQTPRATTPRAQPEPLVPAAKETPSGRKPGNLAYSDDLAKERIQTNKEHQVSGDISRELAMKAGQERQSFKPRTFEDTHAKEPVVPQRKAKTEAPKESKESDIKDSTEKIVRPASEIPDRANEAGISEDEYVKQHPEIVHKDASEMRKAVHGIANRKDPRPSGVIRLELQDQIRNTLKDVPKEGHDKALHRIWKEESTKPDVVKKR